MTNQQNALGEMRRPDSIYDGVVCPKPRRPFHDHISISRLYTNHQTEFRNSRAGAELLDMILTKGSFGAENPNTLPFFCGSPPSRASNPVIQDAQFGNDKVILAPEASPSSAACKQGVYVRAKFGHMPAQVRIEGFNCRGNCSISAVA